MLFPPIKWKDLARDVPHSEYRPFISPNPPAVNCVYLLRECRQGFSGL